MLKRTTITIPREYEKFLMQVAADHGLIGLSAAVRFVTKAWASAHDLSLSLHVEEKNQPAEDVRVAG